MNTIVPIEIYTPLYYYFMMVLVLYCYIESNRSEIDDSGNLKTKNAIGGVIAVLVTLYIGLRPISGKYFGDMGTYAQIFQAYANGASVRTVKDVEFNNFMKFCSSIMSVEVFFLCCALLYIVPLYVAMKRMFARYWFYGFLAIIVSMSFWSYGTNGIRNGMATSFFILAMTRRKVSYTVLWMLMGLAFHKSLLIPIAAFVISGFYTKSLTYLRIWFLAIPVSAVLGGFWENFFMNLGLVETDRLEGYLGGDSEFAESFSSTGFRWDFLLYSGLGVFTGWYFIVKKKFEDVQYVRIYNIYLLANTLWILVIRAAFSNRFAYLSWFLLGIVVIYPLLVNRFFTKQHLLVGRMLVVYFLVTFILNVLL